MGRKFYTPVVKDKNASLKIADPPKLTNLQKIIAGEMEATVPVKPLRTRKQTTKRALIHEDHAEERQRENEQVRQLLEKVPLHEILQARLRRLKKGDQVILQYATTYGQENNLEPPTALQIPLIDDDGHPFVHLDFRNPTIELTGESPFEVYEVFESHAGRQGIVVIRSHAGYFAVGREAVWPMGEPIPEAAEEPETIDSDRQQALETLQAVEPIQAGRRRTKASVATACTVPASDDRDFQGSFETVKITKRTPLRTESDTAGEYAVCSILRGKHQGMYILIPTEFLEKKRKTNA